MSFTIEKDVPLPPISRRGRYPWCELGIGDSFYIDEPATKVRSAASMHTKTHGRKFIVRKEGNGCRCWRIA